MSAWLPVIDRETTPAELDAAIDEQTTIAIADLQTQLDADPDFTDAERAAILQRSAVLIHQQTREVMTPCGGGCGCRTPPRASFTDDHALPTARARARAFSPCT